MRLMRVVWAWPDPSRRPWMAFAARNVISTAFSLIAVTSAAYIVSGEFDNMVNALSNFNDVVASVVVIVKVQSGFHYGPQVGWLPMRSARGAAMCAACLPPPPRLTGMCVAFQLLAMRTSLQHSFSAVESMLAPEEARDANLRCLRKARSFSRLGWWRRSWSSPAQGSLMPSGFAGRRFMTVFYALVCSSGLGINLANVALGRGERQLNIKAPAYVTHTDWLYFPLFTCTMIMFSSFIFISGMPH